ncbi:MAG TPA: hypothetical protein ENN45_01385, partial [Bacteroidetes bacterium]|nr:hypothetical protein [Bacteroidota bacterium]
YVHITDDELTPTLTYSMPANGIHYSSCNLKMLSLLNESKPDVFCQAFPSAKTSWLREVYYIECKDSLFGEKLKLSFGDKIPLIEYLCEPQLTLSPNDPLIPDQSQFSLTEQNEAWEYYFDLEKVPIGITDTYFDLSHEDLDFIGVQGSNLPYYKPQHGNLVSGMAAAKTNNNLGIASVGYDTRIYGSSNWGSDSEVLNLVEQGYKVINCSWLNNCFYSAIQEALYNEIRNVWDAVVVFGAGNSHCGNPSNYCYPASYDVNISVTSVTHTSTDPDAHERTIGDTTTTYQHNDAVDICAHGYGVRSCDVMGAGGVDPGNYTWGWGTSFAAPQVAATLAAIFTINPCLTANEAEDILLDAADASILSYSYNTYYTAKLGTGRLNVLDAVKGAAESATTYFEDETLSSSQTTETLFGISFDNVTISSGTHTFRTRKEISINGNFQINSGVTCTFDVDVSNIISCY